MNRWLGFLLLALSCALAALWWNHPADRVLEDILSTYEREEEPTPQAAEVTPAAAAREELATAPGARTELQIDETVEEQTPVSRVTGVVSGGTDAFPAGQRSGVQVYCWPGWYDLSPPKIRSTAGLRGLQVVETDAQGRFAFDLDVDDTHWLFAIGEGICSDPAGMRLGTKPGVTVDLEMRRLVGAAYRVRVSGEENQPVDAVTLESVKLDEAARGEVYASLEFPLGFLPAEAARGPARGPELRPAEGRVLVRLDPETISPIAAELRVELPGFFPLRESLPLTPVSPAAPLRLFDLRAQTDQLFGSFALDLEGLPPELTPVLLDAPFCSPLRGWLIETTKGHRIPLQLNRLSELPLWRIRVPAGEYRLDLRDHSNVRVDLGVPETLRILPDETTAVTGDVSQLKFWVFSRDLADAAELRFLTPPRIRIPNHEEPSFPDWMAPTQLVVLYPHGEDTPIAISGDVFLDGPRGPRTSGQVTYYSAGIDDD